MAKFIQLRVFKARDMKEGTITGYVNVEAISEVYENTLYPEVCQVVVDNRNIYVDMPPRNLIDRIRTASA